MTGSNRKLGLLLAAALLTGPVALAQDVESTFKQGLELLERGRKEEALRAFQKVLSMDPSNEQAYELWRSTDHKLWLEILTAQGDMELVGRRLMGLVEMARRERRNDQESIRKLIADLNVDDVVTRNAAIRQLAADHGEFAVPHLLGWLGDSGNDGRRITAVQALTQMNVDVVLPLIEVLDSSDAYLRQNVLMVLQRIRDPRAAGALARVAKSDEDGVCRTLAQEALNSLQADADAAVAWTKLGDDYHMRRATVLSDYHWSTVVWNFADGRLAPTETPRALYADALAKKCYHRALAANANHVAAHAGLARAHAGEVAAIASLRRAGADVSAWEAAGADAEIAIGLGGAVAADAALAACIAESDSAAGVVLVRALAEMASAPTAAMARAMGSADGAIQNEAVVALGNMAIWGKSRASAELIRALGAVAARNVLRTAFVIDADAARAKATADALRGAGMLVNGTQSGVQGLAMLRRMAGVDLVVVADRLTDVTTHQVLDELKGEAHLAAPVFIATANPDEVADNFGEKAAGAFDASDLSAVMAALEGTLGAERERADALAQAAADILARLAGTGTDVSAAASQLASALDRVDGVSVPAAYALCAAGNAGHVAALSAVVGDAGRSDAVREAAASALTAIFGRGVDAGDAAAILSAVVRSGSSVAVRKAAAQALGASTMTAAERVGQLSGAGVATN